MGEKNVQWSCDVGKELHAKNRYHAMKEKQSLSRKSMLLTVRSRVGKGNDSEGLYLGTNGIMSRQSLKHLNNLLHDTNKYRR